MAQQENYRFRGGDALKAKWVEACERMKVSQNDCFLSLVALFVAQDELTREAMVRRGDRAVVTIKERKHSR